jgi:hypothetical protein
VSNDLSIDTSGMNVLFVHSAIDDFPLSTEEFRVYAHIARRAGGGEAWPAMSSIATKCHIHEDTARRCVHALTAYRLLSVEDRSKQGKTNRYRLTAQSAWMTHEEAQLIQAGKVELERAKRRQKSVAKAEAIARGEAPRQKSVKKPGKGGLLNEGRGSEGVDTPPKRREASETKGDEVNPLRGSIEVTPTAVVNFTELNAQPENPAPPVAVMNPPEVTTTEDASLPNTSVAETADGPSPADASGEANGEAPELTDEEAEFLFGGQDDNATDLEQVPGGAAAAVLAEASEDHDPEATRAVLTPNLGGQKKLNTLMEEKPPGLVKIGKTRRAWITEITPERAEELVIEARTGTVAHPWTAITELLDREVGAKIQRGSKAAVVANGGATNVLKPGASRVQVDAESAPNAYLGIWEFRTNPEIVADVVAATPSGEITLRDGATMRSADLVIKYRKTEQPRA